MKPSEVAEMIRQALNERYPTGITFIQYNPDSSVLDVEWVDDSSDQIDIDVRQLAAGEQRWKRVQG